MAQKAVENGDLKPGGTIIECTSGNTGIGRCTQTLMDLTAFS